MSPTPTREDVLAIVKRQLLEVMDDLTEEQIDPQRSMTELGAKNLDIVEVVSLSMRELGVKIPRAELALLDELVDTLHAAAVKAAGAPPIPVEENANSADDPEGEARRLTAEYNDGADEARRIEIVYELSLDGHPAARRALAAIYHTVPEWRVKTELLYSISSISEDDIAPLIDVLGEGLRDPNAVIRDAALDAMHGFTHPQTLPLWRQLLTDPDPDLQKEAKTMIETLTEAASEGEHPTPNR